VLRRADREKEKNLSKPQHPGVAAIGSICRDEYINAVITGHMPWTKHHKTPCYIHCFKRNGDRISLSFGSGPEAELVARWFASNTLMTVGLHDDSREDPLAVDGDILSHIEDTSNIALNQLISLVTQNPNEHATLLMQLIRLEGKLAGPDASTLVLLLARRITSAWCECHVSDYLFYRLLAHEGGLGAGLGASGDLQKWRNRASKKLLSTIKALAVVRRIEMLD
jgi:hypothetical protein